MQIRDRVQSGFVAILMISAVLFILLAIPAMMSVVLSFQSYSPVSGLVNSMFVGLENYARFFSSASLPNLLFNSIRLSLVGSVLPVLIGMVAAQLICESGAKPLMLTGLLLPAFIPNIVYASLALSIVPLSFSLTLAGFDLSFFIVSGIPKLFFSAYFCSTFGYMMKDTALGSKKGATFAGIILLIYSLANIFSPNFEAINLLTNPLNFQFSETLDLFVYRTGLMMLDFSFGATIWVIKQLLQLTVLVVAAILFYRFFVRLNGAFAPPNMACGEMYDYNTFQPRETQNNIFPALVGTFVATTVVVLSLSVPFLIGDVTTEVPPMFSVAFFNSMLVLIAASTLFILILGLTVHACLSFIPYSPPAQQPYAPNSADNSGKIIFIAVIALAVVSQLSDNLIGRYLYFMMLGMVNTYLPILLSEFIKPDLLLCSVVLSYVAIKTQKGESGRLSTALPYLLIYAGMFASNLLGSSLYETIYINDSLLLGLAAMARNVIHGESFALIVMLCISLPSILFGGLLLFFNGKTG